MNAHKKSYLALGAAMLLLSALLTACAQPAAEPEEGPPTENTAVYAWEEFITTFDPSAAFSWEVVMMTQMYESLTFFNQTGSDELIGPNLATSWESNEDGTEWTFQLREGVKFHDGADFNAEAVKASFERTSDPKYGPSFLWAPIEEIEVVDDHTIKFHLSFPAALDLLFAAPFGGWMISPNALDNDEAWFNEGRSAGTGPYFLDSYAPGDKTVLRRFDDYWGGWDDNQISTVVYQNVEDVAVREQMARAGEASFTFNIAEENLSDLQQVDGVDVQINPSFEVYTLKLNGARPPLDNITLRQALAFSFPYQEAATTVMAGYATKLCGMIPPLVWGHDPTLCVEQDLDRAAELLAEAGFPDGGVELTLAVRQGVPAYRQMAELWQAELAKIGVDLIIQTMSGDTILESILSNPAEAPNVVTFDYWPTYVSPADYLFTNFHTDGVFNVGIFSNSDFDSLVEEGMMVEAFDRDEASRLYSEAQGIMVDEAASIFVVNKPNIHLLDGNLAGYVDNPAYGSIVFWHDISVEQ